MTLFPLESGTRIRVFLNSYYRVSSSCAGKPRLPANEALTTRNRIILSHFFFPDSKISPSLRGVFKLNWSVYTHPKVGAAMLVYCSIRDQTRCCYVIEKISGFTIHTLSDSLRIYFFAAMYVASYAEDCVTSPKNVCVGGYYACMESELKNTWIRCRIWPTSFPGSFPWSWERGWNLADAG